ncbi:MAG: NTP transferase domain-containing protein [Planctomycetes bacterium]|nr:NTP transferase domain-containing protein [Planctomycetota bacterium]
MDDAPRTLTADELARCSLSEHASVSDALGCVEREGLAVLRAADGRIVGVLRDAELRAAHLRGCGLSEAAARWSVPVPLEADTGGRLPYQRTVDGGFELVVAAEPAVVVQSALVLAGGLGSRMGALTQQIPKPLLPVAGRPMLEHVLEHLARCGVREVTLALNHLAEQIAHHIGRGERFGLQIRFLREDRRMGTAGALSLLQPLPSTPIFVVNADVLTRANLQALAAHHLRTEASVTLSLVPHSYDVPFGVVRTAGTRIVQIQEKPRIVNWCNAGIYCVSPSLIAQVPRNTYVDMTTMIETLIARGEAVEGFPLWEYWRDAGTPGELERASAELERL